MLDPKAVQEYFAPYIQANEAARIEGLRKGIADDYMNAPDAIGKRNALMNGAIQQLVSESLANMGHQQYVTDRPQFTPINTGGEYVLGSVDPTTGKYSEQSRMPMSLTPQQVQAGQQWQAAFDRTNQVNDRDFAYKQKMDTENAQRLEKAYNDSRIDADRTYELQRRGQPTITRLEDGRRIATYPDGTEKELTPDTVGFTSVEKARLAQLETQRQGLIAQQTDLVKAQAKAQQEGNTAEVQSLTASLNNNNAAIKRIDGEIDAMYTGKLSVSPTGTQTISSIVSNANAGRFTGHYGDNRKDHTHRGTDIPAPEGEPIKAIPSMGSNFKVSRVETEPNNPSKYGCAVWLQGERDGHKVQILLGHMLTIPHN